MARAVSPLRENVRDTERRLSQQYASLEGQVQELHIRQDNLEQEVYRRLSDAEAGIAGMRAGWNHSRPRTPTPEGLLKVQILELSLYQANILALYRIP